MDNKSLSHTRWKCQYHIVSGYYRIVITVHILIRANKIASIPIPKHNKLKKREPPPAISFKVSVTSAGFFGL